MSAPEFRREVENLIADMRGLPRNLSRARVREAKRAADLMDTLLQKYRIGMAKPEDAIREAWPEIVGEANAVYCQPERIGRGGRQLVVAVSNPIVRQELHFHKATILGRVRAIPGCEAIREIALRAG